MKEMVGGCCVCSDDRGWTENPLVYCDGQGCTVAVHQACYGIVSVPSGNWYCRKCESPDRSARAGPRQQHCELCPCKDGAIKRTDNNGWAHVVCALYIPEVRFGNVTTMEPIVLQHIPPERFNKSCYICEESGKGSRAAVGACMQCNKSGCKQTFHVTCAQALGLLCEEAGNYLDNVKYCGYCQHHYSKLKKGANVKTVPPYRPVSSDSPNSPDKDGEWPKPTKRKLSTSGSKSSASASAVSNTPTGGKSASGKASPSQTSENTPSLGVEEPVAPLTATPNPAPGSDPGLDQPPPATLSANGKFTTSNFVESVVTPSASVFGDSGKPGKKRKSQAKEESPTATAATVVNPGVVPGSTTDEKRTKVEGSVTPAKPPEPPTPSVVVKLPSAAANPPPPATKPPPTSVASLAPAAPPVSAPSAPAPSHSHGHGQEDSPIKRGRSQSSDKSDKGRKQKRGGSSTGSKRGGRSSQSSPLPVPGQPLPSPTPPVITSAPPSIPAPQLISAPTPVVMPVNQAMKESPPSSPSPETKIKPKKQTNSREDKMFQNGVSAPHMLGNQLNPASTMAQKMSDTLTQELEAHSIYSSEPNLSVGQLVGPPLHNRVLAGVRDQTPPAQSWNNGTSSMPQTLDQLLERQWEQGSQFLMEQAQHFDIASLLTCLHQLRAENLRLEEHVNSLLQRRDHLLAVNARLAIPLIPPAAPAPPPSQPTVNNIHSGGVPPGQPPRGNNNYPPTENGPTSPGHPYQQNPTSRHLSPGSTAQTYACSAQGGVVRSTNPESRRSSGPPVSSHSQQGYPSMYGQQPQMVMRRDVADLHHSIPASKPS